MKYSIVLIEDSRDDIYLVREALTSAGLEFDLRVIEDGGQAAVALGEQHSKQPDLWLIDLNLPKADGFQIIRMVRAQANFAGAPVIVMSSSDAQRDRARAREAGVSGYFCKPLDLDEFMKLGGMVRALLETRLAAGPE